MEIIDGGEIILSKTLNISGDVPSAIEIKCPLWQTGCGIYIIQQYFARQIFSHKTLISEIGDWTKEVEGKDKLEKDDLLKLVNLCSEWEKKRNFLKVICGDEEMFKKCEHYSGQHVRYIEQDVRCRE